MTSTTTVDQSIMADCIAANVPKLKASRYGRQPVQVYVTGGWPVEWSDAQIAEFPRKIRTAQQPAPLIDDGSNAREMDVENGAATPADWPEFYRTRTDQDRATCYMSLSTLPAIVASCHDAGIPLPPRIRFAWWWENPADGSPLDPDVEVQPPTIQQVLEELDKVTGLTVPERVLWACQFVHYPAFDLTKIYGDRDYSRR